ncbi:MAG: outer membrane lipoprotein-sorting protein [Deltaproteobacteria bacterium]|nr:outer membrane lipoprotein-sorting protein [Deltaproteobacteria bacterium]
MRITSILLALLFILPHQAKGLTGKEILEQIDRNYEVKSRISTATMVVKGRRGTRTITSKTWAEGLDKTFTHYLSPPREKDTKMLKLGDELWIWSPSADRTIKIAGHMLRQSLMGSDVSYEDFMEDPRLANSYHVILSGEEAIDGRSCYVLDLKAMEGKRVSYYRRKLWVDKERFLPIRETLYARSGKLLKKLSIKEVFKLENRWYPKRMVFKDVLIKGAGTEIIIDSVQFDVPIEDHIFSRASLRK